MTIKTVRVKTPKAPNLPLAPVTYEKRFHEQFSNALRLYFNQVDTIIESLFGITGTKTLRAPYGIFYNTTSITAPAATVTSITLNTTDLAFETHIGTPTSRIYVDNSGIYNIQFSLQLSNDENPSKPDDVTVWFRLNGVDVPNSASIIQVPGKQSIIYGHTILALNFMLEMEATDYFEMYWTTDSGNSSIVTYNSSSIPPVHPAAPAVILSVSFVSAPSY
jgi:hypothetical protein